RAIRAGELLTASKRRLQRQDSRSGRLGLVQPAKLCERGGEQHVGDAVTRMTLQGLVCRGGRLFVAAPLEMSQHERMECSEGPGVERAQPYTPCGPLDRLLRLPRPSENYAAQDIGKGRRRAGRKSRCEW